MAGTVMSSYVTVDGTNYWYKAFSDVESLNIIFNMGNGSCQTPDITGITADRWFEYDGSRTANVIDVPTGIDNIDTDDAAQGEYVIYNLRGARVAKVKSVEEAMKQMPKGVYIVKGRKILVK